MSKASDNVRLAKAIFGDDSKELGEVKAISDALVLLQSAHERVYYDQAVGDDDYSIPVELAIGMLWDARKYLEGQDFTSERTRPLMGLYTTQFFNNDYSY